MVKICLHDRKQIEEIYKLKQSGGKTNTATASKVDASIDKEKLIKLVLNHLERDHNYTEKDIQQLLWEEDAKDGMDDQTRGKIQIPVSIFTSELGSLETVVKFLRENKELRNKDAAALVSRSERTVWTTFNNSKKKQPGKLNIEKDNRFFFPTDIFHNRKFSTLEAIVTYLKRNYNLSLHQIALLLKRDDSTIWTVYNRAMKK